MKKCSEASGRDTASKNFLKMLKFQALRYNLKIGSQMESYRAGFSFYKYHFGIYKGNESEPHVPLLLPNWPFLSFRNPNFIYRNGFPSKHSTNPYAPMGPSWSPFKSKENSPSFDVPVAALS